MRKNPLLQMCLAFLKANLNVLHFEKALVPSHYNKNQLAETHNPSQGTTNQRLNTINMQLQLSAAHDDNVTFNQRQQQM